MALETEGHKFESRRHWNNFAALINVFMNPQAKGINASAQTAIICAAGVVLCTSVCCELLLSFIVLPPLIGNCCLLWHGLRCWIPFLVATVVMASIDRLDKVVA